MRFIRNFGHKIFFLIIPICGYGYISEKEALNRITSHLIIKDFPAAVKESKEALQAFPDSQAIKKHLSHALAENGEEHEALEIWKQSSFETDERERQDLLETLAWGVLKKGENSSQIDMRLMALLGAFFTHDAKALSSLKKKLRSSNAHERALAVRLSSLFRDGTLKEEIRKMLDREKVWYVRLELIQAIGTMGIEEEAEALKEIIGNAKATLEEKMASTQALLTLYDRIDDEEFIQLMMSNRAGLRMLASEIVLHLDLKHKIPQLIFLLDDPSPDVRVSVLNVLGILGIDYLKNHRDIFSKVVSLIDCPTAEIAMTAAWVILPLDSKKALLHLEKWLEDKEPEIRRCAAAIISKSGKEGDTLHIKAMENSKDPYVKANLALGLIAKRKHVDKACDILFDFLETEKQNIMWERIFNPFFMTLSPSIIKHIPQVPNYPVVMDKMTRLHILNLLAILRYDKAQQALKDFLNTNYWGITGTAALMLLQEGDSETLDLIKKLMDDKNQRVRLQSALAMALLGGDPDAVKVLEDTFPHVDKEMKTHILEAIGHIGEQKSIPFLLNVFDEPFQSLRLVAASSLIQCIYH